MPAIRMAIVALVVIQFAVDASADPTTAAQERKAIQSLRDGGAILFDKDGESAAEGKDVVEIVYLVGDADAVDSLSNLQHLPSPENVTLEIRILKGGQSKKLAAQAGVLKRLKGVAISFSMDFLTSDIDLENVSRIENLTRLSVNSLQRLAVTDEGLKSIKRLKRLRVLSLNNTRISDAGLVHLKGLSKLEFLSLMRTDVNGNGLRHLKGAPVQSLLLVDTKVDDDGLKVIGEFKGLERLFLTNCPVKGPGLKHLTSLKKLRDLVLSGTRIDDGALKHVSEIPNLRSLSLHRCNVTDAGIEHLKKMKSLRKLLVSDTKLTPAGIKKLQMHLPAVKLE